MSIPNTELTESVQLARDLLRMTLHGAPPVATTMKIAEALVALAATARKMDGDLAALRIEHALHVDLLAAARREREEARADMADVQARYARAWEALCSIGEAIEAAGYPQLLPERALRVGEGVAKVIRERDELRTSLRGAYILGYRGGHEDTVEGRYNGEPGERWDEDGQLRADAALAGSGS